MRWRGRMARIGQAGKVLLGAFSVAVSLLILTGLDREFEAILVNVSPDWPTNLTTQF
jgi:cytochrome c-type biogenesis protein